MTQPRKILSLVFTAAMLLPAGRVSAQTYVTPTVKPTPRAAYQREQQYARRSLRSARKRRPCNLREFRWNTFHGPLLRSRFSYRQSGSKLRTIRFPFRRKKPGHCLYSRKSQLDRSRLSIADILL